MASDSSAVASRGSVITAYRAVVGIMALGVLIQAVIAGQFLYGTWSIVAHGIIGNVAFMLAIVATVLAIVGKLAKRLVAVPAVLVLLMTVQIGLGYVAETRRAAGAWHIPLGVTIFALTVYLMALLRLTRDGR